MASLAIARKILLSQQVCAEQKIWFSQNTSQITTQQQTTMLHDGRTGSIIIIATDHALLWRHLQRLPTSPPHADISIARPVAVLAAAP